MYSFKLYAQGCSDAGFCTIDGFSPDIQHSNIKLNSTKFGITYGKADHSISGLSNFLEYNRQLSSKFAIDVKITSIYQNGDNVSVFGFSDIFFNLNYKFIENTRFILGTKIPLNNSNIKKDGMVLPMDYQPSLGTFDIIAGISHLYKNFQFIFALQQPLTQNKNEFLVENPSVLPEPNKFHSTNKYERAGDVLLRVSYPFAISDKFTITPSILPIYHLANDKYTNIDGIIKEIEGSQGLTLNINTILNYKINEENSILLNIAFPLIVRKERPDGLTRSFIAGLEYKVNF